MRVLGVDPGYDRLGIAIIEKISQKETLLFSSCVTTKKGDDFPKRLTDIGRAISDTIAVYKPNALAIENLFFNKNQKTALLVASARGVILYEAEKAGLSIFEYTPLEVKNAIVGYGRGDKKQVQHMVHQLITIEKTVSYDDEYDAIAVGITCFATEHGFQFKT